MYNLSKAISILFHPLWMPILGTYILFTHTLLAIINPSIQTAIYKIIAVSTIGMPLLILVFFWYLKKFKSLEMNEPKERFFPLIIISIFYLFSFFALYKVKVPEVLYGFMMGSFVSTVCAAIINLRWKISLHAIGMGGITALITLIALMKYISIESIFFQTVLISGVVLTARLWLNKHSIWQVIAGYLLGFFVISITILCFI